MSMKIAVRPLKGDSFEVEVEPTDKVEQLKAKIAVAKPEFSADAQKLIYSGRILTNETSIADVGIKEGEFVVVMVAKAKAPAAAEAPAAPAPAPAPAAAPDAPMGIDQASANLVSGGAAIDSTVAQLMEMGFERAQVERCLRAAFNNPDRAVEYLMSGIPPGAEQAADGGGGGGGAPPPAAGGGGGGTAPPPAAGGGGASPFPAMGGGGGGGGGGAQPFPQMAGAGGGGGGGGGAPLSASAQAALQELRNNPRFPEFAQMIAQNPAMLAQILPVLAQQSPDLVQLISENPDAFRQALQEAVQGGAGGGAGVPPNDPVAAMLAAAQGGGGAGGVPPGATVVRLTEDERAAVERLTGLGFDQQQALQAYLACDKNEELAANFLFDAPMED